MPLDHAPALSRRGFVTAAASAGGLLICASIPHASRAAAAAPAGGTVTAWVSIAADETVTILCGTSEMGQGSISGLPQVLAEELLVDWTRVKTAEAPTALAYINPLIGAQLTGGSSAMRGYFQAMLLAGATAREMLVAAAAAQMGVTPGDCTAANGVVTVAGSGKFRSYGQVAADAARLTPPASPVILSKTAGYHLVGKSVPRPDIPAKVRGAATYGIDVRLPGMCYAAIKHAPAVGGTFAALPALPAGAIGIMPIGKTAVAVVVDHDKTTWDAFRAADSLKIAWTTPAASRSLSSASIMAQARTLMTTGHPIVAESAGDVAKAMLTAARTVSVTYSVPYVPHACMEVLNCTVSITATGCEIWAPTQGQSAAVQTAAKITGLDPAKITLHTTFLGGGLGRKFEQDFVAEAVTIAKALGKPVKLTWSREEDFTHDQWRPFALCRVIAGLDAAGNIVAWQNRIVSPSILAQRNWIAAGGEDGQAVDGAIAQPYKLGARRVDWVVHPSPVPVGFWRSVGNSYNAFVVECAIDEIAAAAGVDPLAYRRRLLAGNAPALKVLNAAATLGKWGSALPAGHARGIAFHECFGSVVAQVIEVTRTGVTATSAGTIKLVHVACAVDCGFAVNPDSVVAQIQGGIVHGLNAALWGQTTFDAGRPSPANFDNYRMMRMRDMPRIDVAIVETGGKLGGIGEVGVPCVAPALANAWAALTGKRIRDLPMFASAGGGD